MSARLLIVVDLSRPWALIRSPIDMEVVLVLRGTTRPLTGREVARLVRAGSQPTVNASLRRLAEEGLVHAEEAGNAYLYTFNRQHLAAPALEQLAGIRSELERRLRTEIAEWEIAPTHASIFGSAARGDGDNSSDIDVFVVRAPRTTRAGGRSSTDFPSTFRLGPATTSGSPRSRRPTSADSVASAPRSSKSCARMRSTSRAQRPLISWEPRHDEAKWSHATLRPNAGAHAARQRTEVARGRRARGWRGRDPGVPKCRRGARRPLRDRVCRCSCCAALGRRSRGEDHREAAALLHQIVDGDRAAKALIELLNLKDTAQYGLIPITRRELTTAIRRAKTLIDFAGEVMRR